MALLSPLDRPDKRKGESEGSESRQKGRSWRKEGTKEGCEAMKRKPGRKRQEGNGKEARREERKDCEDPGNEGMGENRKRRVWERKRLQIISEWELQ